MVRQSSPPHSLHEVKSADPIKRMVAGLIDGIIAGLVSYLMMLVIPVLDGILGGKLWPILRNFGMPVPFLGILFGTTYILIRDALPLWDGKRSLGKLLMGIRPMRLDGKAMDLSTSVGRNWPLAVGGMVLIIPYFGLLLGPLIAVVFAAIELVLVLSDGGGRRWGDRLAGTGVVE